MNGLQPYLRLLRPHQWVKSGFVFAGLLFGHAWHDAQRVEQVLLAAVAFSLAASAVYVLNDLSDRELDRLHPHKRHWHLPGQSARLPWFAIHSHPG